MRREKDDLLFWRASLQHDDDGLHDVGLSHHQPGFGVGSGTGQVVVAGDPRPGWIRPVGRGLCGHRVQATAVGRFRPGCQ